MIINVAPMKPSSSQIIEKIKSFCDGGVQPNLYALYCITHLVGKRNVRGRKCCTHGTEQNKPAKLYTANKHDNGTQYGD